LRPAKPSFQSWTNLFAFIFPHAAKTGKSLAKRMHAGLVIERQEIAITRQNNPVNGSEPPTKRERGGGFA
jgi:hypothetical protein